MFLEYFDLKRTDWSADALATVLTRLQESGYQGLTVEILGLLGRFVQRRGDRAADASRSGAERFSEILIPPAQPHTRVILHRAAEDVARVVVMGRSQHEVHISTTAIKMHLEHALGSKLKDLITDENGRAGLSRFRREVLPTLELVGEERPSLRHPNGASLLKTLKQQPVFRGKPTLLASQVNALALDRPAEAQEMLEQLVGEGLVERWHVVVCREGSQWLAVSPNADEIKAFVASNVACPHCGRRVNDERADTAYRLAEDGQSYLGDNRWMSDLVETTLRRLGVEAVTVQPGGRAVDGAACYHGSVLLFRAREGVPSAADAQAVRDDVRALESKGWRVYAILVSDQPVPEDVKSIGVTVVEGVGALEPALAEVLNMARSANLQTLLPAVLYPVAVSLVDLVPLEQPQTVVVS